MFIGAPTATRASFDSRDRAHTIDHLTSNSLHEPNHHSRRDKSRITHSSLESSRFIKLQDRTKTLLFRLLVLGIYITSGAAIFHVVESQNEDEQNFCHATGDSKVEIEMSRKFNVSMKEIKKIVLDLCDQFESSHRCKYSHNDWSYYQSLYFVGSVVTTIGYGHLAPKTQEGRLFLIFYAFFGIPINLLALQSIGEHINLGFHKLIALTERKLYKNSTVRHEHIKTFFLSVVLMLLMLPIGGLMYYYSEKEKGWTYLDSVYYSFVAISTIGFGDLVPNEGKEPKSTYEQVMWFIRLLFLGLGLSLVSSVFTSVSGATKQIKNAYMSKKGVYEINGERAQKTKEQSSFTEGACIQVKELLCSVKTDRPTKRTSDVYSKFEDSMSTTSLSFNQSQHDDHVTYLQDPSRRGRSISMALSQVGLGVDYTLDWATGTPVPNHSTSCNVSSQPSTTNIEMETLQKTTTLNNGSNDNDVMTSPGNDIDVTNVTSSSSYHDVVSLTSLDSNNENAIVTPSDINIDNNLASVEHDVTTLTSLNSNKEDKNITSSGINIDNEDNEPLENNHDVTGMTSVDSYNDVRDVTLDSIDACVTSSDANFDVRTSGDEMNKINSADLIRNGACGHSQNCRDDVIASKHVINEMKPAPITNK